MLACLPASDGVDANYGADRGRCFRISLFNNDAFKPPDALDGQTMMKFDDNAVININAWKDAGRFSAEAPQRSRLSRSIMVAIIN
jgi:hypothetical protein